MYQITQQARREGLDHTKPISPILVNLTSDLLAIDSAWLLEGVCVFICVFLCVCVWLSVVICLHMCVFIRICAMTYLYSPITQPHFRSVG